MVLVLRQVTKSQRTRPHEGRKRAYLKPTCPRRMFQKAWREEHLSRCLKYTRRLFLEYMESEVINYLWNCLFFCAVCMKEMMPSQAQGFPLLGPPEQLEVRSTTRPSQSAEIWEEGAMTSCKGCLGVLYWKGYIRAGLWIAAVKWREGASLGDQCELLREKWDIGCDCKTHW